MAWGRRSIVESVENTLMVATGSEKALSWIGIRELVDKLVN